MRTTKEERDFIYCLLSIIVGLPNKVVFMSLKSFRNELIVARWEGIYFFAFTSLEDHMYENHCLLFDADIYLCLVVQPSHF